MALCNLGLLAADQRDTEAAKSYLERGVRLYQQIGAPIPDVVQSALDSLAAP
jgi:hypothetical protein